MHAGIVAHTEAASELELNYELRVSNYELGNSRAVGAFFWGLDEKEKRGIK